MEILLVEDNLADARWFELMLAESGVNYHLSVAKSGDHALDFLLKCGEHTAAPDVDIVFVDINLPRVPGVVVLEEMRTRDDLKHTPACVLSGSPVERMSVVTQYRLDIRCYIVKPITITALLDAFRSYDRLIPLLSHLPSVTDIR
jgi:DNA-binding response OmpR family regulator